MEQPKRRIVKETTIYGIDDNSVVTQPRGRFIVQKLTFPFNSIYDEWGKLVDVEFTWETEIIPIGNNFIPNTPAIFQTMNEAVKYVNGEYGKTGKEVVWESE